jgi:hypothetical protein
VSSQKPDGQAPGQLDHRGEVFVNFKNGTYQWVDIQRFQLPTGVSDQTALVLLVEHEFYGCDYAGGGHGEDPTRHGPYWRNQITPNSFDPADAAAEETRLRAWAEEHAELPDRIRADLETSLYGPLRTADRVYRLRDLGSAAFHDWGGVHEQFHELVLIDRTAETLALAVASDD